MTAETANSNVGEKLRACRATMVGVVSSNAREKTIRVTVSRLVRHAKYGKYLRRRSNLHAHDEKNECRKGDIVEIEQTRPLSKTKCWRLLRVITQAPAEQENTAK
jgi:small subunit ribosomal protein S17